MTATAATAGSQDIVVEGEASIMGPSSSSSLWWFIDTKVARQHIRGPYTVSQMGVLFDVGTLTHTTQVLLLLNTITQYNMMIIIMIGMESSRGRR